jgi:Zn-dependent protease
MSVIIFSIIVLLFSVIIHEIAHGSMALALGDTTARDAGRLSLNPLKHLDPIGSVFLPLFLILITQGQGPIFAWAKPVPVNSFNFRDKKWGTLKVSVAGPATNFLIGIFFGLLIRFLNLPQSLLIPFSFVAIYNFILGIFNLIPLYPLDGSHILFAILPERWSSVKIFFQQYGLLLLILLITFGLNWVFSLSNLLFQLISGKFLVI